jgi:hypothetical protein
MRNQVNDHDKQSFVFDLVYDSVLFPQTRGAMTLPIAAKWLILSLLSSLR